MVSSLFVNPKQFGPNEDLSKYPRQLEKDIQVMEREGVDLLFAPATNDEMYPPDFSTRIMVPHLPFSPPPLETHPLLCRLKRWTSVWRLIVAPISLGE